MRALCALLCFLFNLLPGIYVYIMAVTPEAILDYEVILKIEPMSNFVKVKKERCS